MEALITPSNVDYIKAVTELKGLDRESTTYAQLVQARKDSLGKHYGYPAIIEEGMVPIYVLCGTRMDLPIEEGSPNIAKMTRSEFVQLGLYSEPEIEE